MTLINTALDNLDHLGRSAGSLLFGQTPKSMIDLDSAVSESALSCRGQSFVSVIEINGNNTLVGKEEFQGVSELLYALLNPKLATDSGHVVKVIFESDPDHIGENLDNRLKGARMQAARMGLDVTDILDEKAHENAHFCQVEKVWLCFYTTLEMYSKTEQNESKASLGKLLKRYPSAGNSQRVLNYMDDLLETHKASVDSLTFGIQQAGLTCQLLPTDNILKEIVCGLQGDGIAKNWEPDTVAWGANLERRNARQKLVAGSSMSRGERKTFKRYYRHANEHSSNTLEPMLPRTLADQLVPDDFYQVNNFVVTPHRIYAPIHVTQHAQNPSTFDALLQTIGRQRIPFRVAFTLTPNGLSANTMNTMLLNWFSWTSHGNKAIVHARSQLLNDYAIAENGSVVGFSMVASTWAPLEQLIVPETKEMNYETRLIQKRVTKLLEGFTGWGAMQAAPTLADPVEALLSTMPGLIGTHISPPTPAPLSDVVTMLPITRMYSVWEQGANLLRTPDGQPVSYEQVSSEQDAWVTLVVGPMGSGKSSHMNSLNLGFLLEPSSSEHLPMLRGIDFGYSSKGVVDIIRASLPKNQQYRARYIQMKNDVKFAKNVFDTLLGCRHPMPNQKSFLNNFLQTAAFSMKDYPSLSGLCALVVDQAYKKYSDKDHNPDAKRYSGGTSEQVDAYFNELGTVMTDGHRSWWSVVDELYAAGETHLSALAQRYAVPTLEDIVSITMSATVIADYQETYSGQPVTEMFQRAIRECIDELPIYRSVTQFDISQSEVIMLDLAHVVPNNGDDSVQQKSVKGLIYMVAMQILSADFFVDDSYLSFIDADYKPYHAARFKKLSTLKKRFHVDERHRIKGVPAAEDQLDQMITEGRKFNVDIIQGTTMFINFSKAVQELATTIVFCGAGSKTEVEALATHYGLNDTQASVLGKLRGPIPNVGAPALFCFKTKTGGTQFMHLVNTEGPIMLCALATGASERYVREQLHIQCSNIIKARNLFATAFPSGSVKSEVKRRQELMSDGIYVSKAGDILDDIIDELMTGTFH